MIKKFELLLKQHYSLILAILVLTLLLFKNPYSIRTLIPNLEPFPDALYYTTTPRCFLDGQGWKMCRLEDPSIEGIKPAVPPAYSSFLLLGYLVNQDVRTFYFINVILSFISLILLYKVSENFFKNQVITGTILLFYVTNYFVYWFPTLAMAENLFIVIFLSSLLLLQNKVSTHISILVGITAAAFYATKYAFAPLTLVFTIIYFFKILLTKKELGDKIKQTIAVALPATIILANLVGTKQLLSVLNEMFNGAVTNDSSDKVSSGGGYFSINNFPKHIQAYSNGLLGKSQRFLWDTTPLVPRWISLPAILGLLVSFRDRKYIFTKIYLIAAVIAQLLFISTFYVVDIRYIYHFLPILLLGFGFFLQLLRKSLLKKNINFYAFIAMIMIIYLGSNVMRLKSAVMINFKYAETPWWYLSQLQMNDYFDNLESSEEKPILITLTSPFLSDNYSNQNYTSLPLNDQQDFRGTMEKVWGPNDYTDLIGLYNQKLNESDNIYVTNYGVNAAGHFRQSYENIQNKFELEEVQTGCHNLCNIYKLISKIDVEEDKILQ